MGEKMEYREMLDEIWDISQLLKRKSNEIETDGLYKNLKDISEDYKKISDRVMALWENLGGMEDVAQRAEEREAV